MTPRCVVAAALHSYRFNTPAMSFDARLIAVVALFACGGGNGPVAPAQVASIAVTAPSSILQLGGTLQLVATLKDAQGTALTGRSVAWTSSSPDVATVSSTGLVTGHGVGSALISATSESKTGSVTTTVPAVSSIAITGATTVFTGVDVQLAAITKDASGNALTGRSVLWSSSSSAVATVSSGGIVHGVSSGTAVITAQAEGVPATVTITVRPAPPAARWLHGLVYDEARGNVLLFGGSSGDTFFNDLWSWNGTQWTRITTPAAPSARDGMLLTYDAARRLVVMFGGRTAQGPLADTWEWDGATWTQKAATGPDAREHFAGGYDPVLKRTVLYGGQTATNVGFTDTWEWDGTVWQRKATTRPSPLDAASNPVFDAGRQALVMLTGSYSSGATEMWQWKQSAWTVISSGPVMSLPKSVVPISATDFLLLDSDPTTSATWRWNGSVWSTLGISGPGHRFGSAMAFDAGRSQVVLFGGNDGSATLNDSWTFAGNRWTVAP